MPITPVFHPRRVLVAAAGIVLAVSAGACSGVSKEAVRDTTASVTAQVALAKASLVACRGGDRAQCDTAEQNLETIAAENAQLGSMAEE